MMVEYRRTCNLLLWTLRKKQTEEAHRQRIKGSCSSKARTETSDHKCERRHQRWKFLELRAGAFSTAEKQHVCHTSHSETCISREQVQIGG